MNHVPLWNPPGADDSEAESAGGEREAAGPAGALQEVFDTTQHAVGQGPAQWPRAQVTSSIIPPAHSSLSGDTTPQGGPGNLATLRTAVHWTEPALVFLIFTSSPVIFCLI